MGAPLTVAVGEAKPGETAPRRKASQKLAPVERPTDSKATTLPEFIEECFTRNGNRDAMAWRDLLEVHVETKKSPRSLMVNRRKLIKNGSIMKWVLTTTSPILNYYNWLKTIPKVY